jgi:membrane protease YdiL (CAAX protease family)
MHLLVRRLFTILGFGLLALFISTLAGGVWTALMLANIRTTPSIPWAVLVMAVFLWLAWVYLGGKGWPRKTAAARRRYLRARPVSALIYFWTFLTGVLAIISLAGLWIVLFQLFRMPPNVLPEYSRYPVLTVSAFILMGSLVSPLMEEAGFRGYLQVALERDFSVPVALLLSSLFFALAHLNHGLLAPKLLVYFLVGVTFGALAWLTDSILPVIPVHIFGDLTFFILIWPHDKARPLYSAGGASMWFGLHCAQTFVFAALAALAMRRLARLVSSTQPNRNLTAQGAKIAKRTVG